MVKKVICIDPGHGGKDPGGGSNSKFKEKNIVLDISKEQKKHFERNGIKVVMTRITDKFIDSTPRANLVKRSGADYCISNHVNAGGGEGAETIYSVYSNGKVAKGLLKALVNEGAKHRRHFNKANSSGGDWYFMHRLTGNISIIIVEYGFADNASDTQKIINDWKKYAEAVARYYIENVFNQKYIASDDNKSEKPKKEKPSKPKPKPKPESNKIAVDNQWGNGTTKGLQKALGTTVDGVISYQVKGPTTNAIYGKVTYGTKGSQVIRALQKLVGAKVDGDLGAETVRKAQAYFGTTVDGVISRPKSLVVGAMQKWINSKL